MEFGLQRDYLLGQHRSDVTRQRKATALTAEFFVLRHAFSSLPRQKRRGGSLPIRGFSAKTRKSLLEELGCVVDREVTTQNLSGNRRGARADWTLARNSFHFDHVLGVRPNC
jgi:hypothetical protein